MSDKVTIELPDELARRARAIAAAGGRRLEGAVVEWVRRAVAEPEVKALPDAELLQLCDSTMEAEDQQELSNRLADAREGRLDEAGRARLDELMDRYRRGLVLKARAWEEAVARGLRRLPTDDEADTEHAA
jgi:hypothetical protein